MPDRQSLCNSGSAVGDRGFQARPPTGIERAFRLTCQRYQLVVPDLPDLSEYLPLLEEIGASGRYTNFGPLNGRLERELRAAYGAADETCVACSSATAGLSAALLASGKSGCVLLPAFTFPASLGAIRAAGMTPVVVDVNPHNWGLDTAQLERAFAQTDARLVMLVTPFGIRRDWQAELAVCRKWGAVAVIDNASGLGVARRTEDFDENVFEVFSMHATKPFAVGEGGVVFAHHRHERALRAALNFALDSYTQPAGPSWGFNGKLSEFHAAIGIAQLRRFADALKRRQACAAMYHSRLSGYPELIYPDEVGASPWQSFPVLLPNGTLAERFVDCAAAVGIEIRRYYRPSLSCWPQTRCFGPCPVAEDLADRMCVLPVRAGGEVNELHDLVFKSLDRALARC